MPLFNKQMLDRKRRLQDVVFCIIFALTAIFLAWKCRYGIGNIDESFYLTIPYRLFMGDSLFAHEWHLSQMSGVLTLPFVSLFVTMNQGTEGIILAMRYFTVFVQCALSLFAYCRLRKYSWTGAACAAISFMVYIPFGIMALSYNSMGIMALIATGLLFLPSQKHDRIALFFAGISFSAAVLCCPYLAFVFMLYLTAVIVWMCLPDSKRRSAGPAAEILSVRRALPYFVGIVTAAAAFVLFICSRASIDSIIAAFPHIMNDPEHPAISLLSKSIRFLGAILKATPFCKYLYPLLFALFSICLLDKRRKDRGALYFFIAAMPTLILMADHYRTLHYINMVMWSANILGLFVFLLSKKRISRLLFLLFWIPGMAYSFCLHLTSNQAFYAISSASSVSLFASMAMIAVFTGEIAGEIRPGFFKKCTAALACILLVFQLASQFELRYSSVFWESGMSKLTVSLDEGIEAGLYTSEERADSYRRGLKVIDKVKELNVRKVLFFSKSTWMYLCEDFEFATYSAWLSGVNENALARLKEYYSLHPDKTPDAAFIDLENKDMALQFSKVFHYELTQIHDGFLLRKTSASL